MALNNCTITSQSFSKVAGQAIGSDNAQLVITPNEGYVVTASDFTNNSGTVTGIDSITLSNSGTAGAIGNTVLVAVNLTDNYTMPSANTTLTIDIDGNAELISYTLSGNYDTVVSNAAPSTETDTAFSATGNYNQQVTVFTKTFTASSGYYFQTPPSYKLYATNPERYSITHSDTNDSNGNLTARTFTVKYTFSNESQAGDEIKFTAQAVQIFVPTIEITRYALSLASIPVTGETREMLIYGYPGATFSLTVVNEDNTSIKSITNQAIPSEGKFSVLIDFPSVTDNDQYDFVLTGSGVSNNFGGSGQQPHTFNLSQLVDITLAIGLRITDNDITLSPDKSKNLPPLSVLTDLQGNYNNEFTISTSTWDKLIIDDSSVTLTQFTNTNSANNGGSVFEINELTFNRVNDQQIKAKFTGGVSLSGNANVLSTLNLDSYISGNMTPTNIGLSSTTIQDGNNINDVIGTFSTADVGDTSHTYTLVAGTGSTDNSSFNISGTSLRASAVYNASTKNSYSIRVKTTDADGASFEKVFTITIQASSSNSAPTNIQLSSSSINENNAVNAVVGTLSTVDADSGDTHTYTLVSGVGDTDNSSFNISGSSLRASVAFDYEVKSSYSVRVRSTDAAGAFVEKRFPITINDVSESTNSYRVRKHTALGSTNQMYYLHPTQVCSGGNLAAAHCNYGNLTGKFLNVRQNSCSGTAMIVEIIAASSISPNVYHTDHKTYTTYYDASTGQNSFTCPAP